MDEARVTTDIQEQKIPQQGQPKEVGTTAEEDPTVALKPKINPEVPSIPGYFTCAKIVIIGRAACVDLQDAGITGFMGTASNMPNKHMTIAFRRKPRWTPEEILEIQSDCNIWKASQCHSSGTVSFTLSKWGTESCLVHGPLYSLCMHLRQQCSTRVALETQRKPHVALFKKTKSTVD